MSKPAFYAVARGRNPGIYDNYDDCRAQTEKYNNALHKKFHTLEDAQGWLTQNGVRPKRALEHVAEQAAAPVASTSAAPAPSVSAPRQATSSSAAQPDTREAKRQRLDVSEDTKGKGKASKSLLGKDLIQNTEGWQIVYCDGACRGNGKPGAIAGVGVWWGHDDPRNIAERCPGDQTNNRAELIAIVRVLETAPKDKKPILIRTDSSYSINCFKEWFPKWKAKGWRTAGGKPVANLGIIRYLDALLQERGMAGQRVHFEYVKGHSGDVGNDGADYQANRGCEKEQVADPDWVQLRTELEERIGDASSAYQITAVEEDVAVVEPVPIASTSTRSANGASQSTFQPRHRDAEVQTLPWVHPDGLVPQNPSLAGFVPAGGPAMSEAEMNELAACLATDEDLEAELAEG